MKQYIVYSGTTPPLVLIEEACQKRNNGNPCGLYKKTIEEKDGEKVILHECLGNSTWCDHITGMGLVLSDKRSELHKKVFEKIA